MGVALQKLHRTGLYYMTLGEVDTYYILCIFTKIR